MTGPDAAPTSPTVTSLIQMAMSLNGNPLETNAGACPGSALLSATSTVSSAALLVPALAMALVTAKRAGQKMPQAEQPLTRTCADANPARKSEMMKGRDRMAENAERSTSATVELTAISANGTGSPTVDNQIAMESAGASLSRFARLSGAKKRAHPEAMDSAAHTVAIAASLGRLAILTAQPSTADARTGTATIE